MSPQVAYSDPLTTKGDGSELEVVTVSSAEEMEDKIGTIDTRTQRIEYTRDIGGFEVERGGSNRFPLIISPRWDGGLGDFDGRPTITGRVDCRAPFVWFWKCRFTGGFTVGSTDVWRTRCESVGLFQIRMPAAGHRCRRFVEAYCRHVVKGKTGNDKKHYAFVVADSNKEGERPEGYLYAHVHAFLRGFEDTASRSAQYWYARPGVAHDRTKFDEPDPPLTNRRARLLHMLVDVRRKDGEERRRGMREAFYFKHNPAEVGWVVARGNERSLATRGNNTRGMRAHDCDFRDGVVVQGVDHTFDNCDVGRIELCFHGKGGPGTGALRSQVGASRCKVRACRGSELVLGRSRMPYYAFGRVVEDVTIEDWNGSVVDDDGDEVRFENGKARGSGRHYEKATTAQKAASSVARQAFSLGAAEVGPALPGLVRPRPAGDTEADLLPWPPPP